MSQHDFDIANQGFPATRADINNAFQAIASNSSGPTAPSTTYANMWWYDTTNNKMYLRNEADSAWIEVATIDQTNNEWQITTGVVKAKDSDGLALKTDDGTTRLFIKDSDGAVGIGTTSPEGEVDIQSTSPNLILHNTEEEDTDGGRESTIIFKGEQSGGEITTLAQIQASHDGTADDEKGDLIFSTNDGSDGDTPTERLRIDSDGNVGIGTGSPQQMLHLSGTVPDIRYTDTTGNEYRLGNNNGAFRLYDQTDSAERFRVDSSGNLLVGTTTATPATTTGVALGGGGYVYSTRASAPTGLFNRTGTDGEIVQFRKGGSTVGSIGVNSGNNLFISSAASDHAGLEFSFNSVLPQRGGTSADNIVDLGASSYRFDDIYATNGTIQTSDRNEKQQIASLTDAEMTAAKAISKLFKTFKWNDSVAEKGDAARTHTGVIAQEVEQAMTDAGLNAGDYAFFISTTWWETQTEVPAVEADEESGVEAQEAYTRTDTYETAEEAPEGATERNRKGIRYPQLLSFIGAATEQRLASIESRLDALEA